METELNILVVDDEQIVLDSAERHLRQDTDKVFKVLSAEDALKILKKETVHIILTDLMMPDMDGLELMKEVKSKHAGIPIIMVTGYATINTALQAMQLGAFDYVSKPFTKSELRGVVKRAAQLVGGEGAGTAAEPEEFIGRGERKPANAFNGIGGHTWMMRRKSGNVLIGVVRPFLLMIVKVLTVDMPSVGDELRQGSMCLQLFTADLRSHVIWSPLSGSVVKVNEKVLADPEEVLQDSYGEGWLLEINPSRFEQEIKALGL